MDTVKSRILTLEKQVATLEQTLQIVNKQKPGLSQPIAYVTSTEEFLELDIFEEVNAFRFVYKKRNDPIGLPCFEYTLLNPTESMKKSMTDIHGNEENITLISHTQDPSKLEENGYQLYFPQNASHPLGNPITKQKIQEELNQYFFRVYDICSCDIRPVNFDQEITLRFRNTYRTLPHVSLYFSPFPTSESLSWKIKELTQSYLTIMICFPRIPGGKLLHYSRRGTQYETPPGLRLHCWIHGIPEQKEETLLD